MPTAAKEPIKQSAFNLIAILLLRVAIDPAAAHNMASSINQRENVVGVVARDMGHSYDLLRRAPGARLQDVMYFSCLIF